MLSVYSQYPDCQKRLIKTFVNSVFVYDDKVVLTFNYSGDRRTITLKEIDAGLQQGIRIPNAVVHQITTVTQAGGCCCFIILLEIRIIKCDADERRRRGLDRAEQ